MLKLFFGIIRSSKNIQRGAMPLLLLSPSPEGNPAIVKANGTSLAVRWRGRAMGVIPSLWMAWRSPPLATNHCLVGVADDQGRGEGDLFYYFLGLRERACDQVVNCEFSAACCKWATIVIAAVDKNSETSHLLLPRFILSAGGAMSAPPFSLRHGGSAAAAAIRPDTVAYDHPFPSQRRLLPALIRCPCNSNARPLRAQTHISRLPILPGDSLSHGSRRADGLSRAAVGGGRENSETADAGDGGRDGGCGGGDGGGGDRDGWFNDGGWLALLPWWDAEARKEALNSKLGSLASVLPLLCLSLLGIRELFPLVALAGSEAGGGESCLAVWEIRGGKRRMLVPGPSGEDFIAFDDGRAKDGDGGVERLVLRWEWLLRQAKESLVRLMLPDGYPASVTSDYLEYSLWRGVQGIASQVSGVLSTQALLYAVGLGKGAIPTAAAVSWVLKDGIGYLSKILLSKFGRHFDVSPKGWRLFADLLENAAYGLEILTPAFPHLFVFIGAVAGAGRSASSLIQAATRSCFYAGFAAERNFAEVIAKGEAQGMVSKFMGISLGIALANAIGSSTPLALAAFAAVTAVHMYCNLKSYQSIQLRTLNPYRASLVFGEYLLSGQVPGISEVNDEEPLFPEFLIDVRPASNSRRLPKVLSPEAEDAARQIVRRLRLGACLSELVDRREDARALFDLFKNESYLLVEAGGTFHVVLKEESTPADMLKSLFHVSYLYWLERNLGSEPGGIEADCGRGGRLRISLEYAQREFGHVQTDSRRLGWAADGLIARPQPARIRLGRAD
ncbi:root UVB sensitive-like protein (Protein of unknown function, DUF647) [Wolffia australiana]